MKYFKVILLIWAAVGSAHSQSDIEAVPIPGGLTGEGVAYRYWNCCKPACGWSDLVPGHASYVKACGKDGSTAAISYATSICDDPDVGTAYECSDQQPSAVNNTFALGFAGLGLLTGEEFEVCCSCFLIEFGDDLDGKQMIVQITNTAGESDDSFYFNLNTPGGGVGGVPEGCAAQWDADPEHGWGDQYGGVATAAECEDLPEVLQPGCLWRFEWFRGVSNPPLKFTQVECPTELTTITGCTAA